MQYRTHQIGGICAGLIAAVNLVQPPYHAEALGAMSVVTVASLIGSVIPDIDEPNSIAGRTIWPISKLIKKLFGHRMITHTPIFVVAMAVGFFYLGQEYFVQTTYYTWYKLAVLGFLVGYVSHFIMDSLNPTGIMYLWPLSRNRFSILKLKTGKREWIVKALLIIVTVGYLYFMKYPELVRFYNLAK